MHSLRRAEEVLVTSDSRAVGGERSAVRFLDRRLDSGDEPQPGAHIISPRRGYLHHGIYVGNGRVVHYGGLAHGFIPGPVEEVSLAQFASGRSVWTRWRPEPRFDREEIIHRACSRVGEDRYQVLRNNCEHFCEWCIQGEPHSYQVERRLSLQWVIAAMLELITRWGGLAHW